MKKHIITFILLLIAAIAFILRFFLEETLQNYCDIAAFALPTMAALVEVILAEKSGKETEKEIKKLKDNQLSVKVEDGALKFRKGENQ